MEKTQGTYSAHRAFAHARALFTWLLEREDPKRPTLGVTTNPCLGVDPNKFINKREPRQRTLEPAEIRLLWQATEGEPTTTYPVGPYVRLLLILGCRRNELADATWNEFDVDGATWKLVETRVKNNETRIIPLPGMALDILRALPRFAGPHVFSASGGRTPWCSYDASKKAVHRRITALNGGASIGDWRFHDLRRSMRSNLSAIPTISPIVAELMIGHRQQGLARVYDQHKYEAEQRAGFEAWCARLRRIVEPAQDNVVPLRVSS
jgi:integrase